MEGLCAQQSAEHDDAASHGVHPAVPAARSPVWLRAHPLLWLPGQSPPKREPRAVSGVAAATLKYGRAHSGTTENVGCAEVGKASTAVPALPRTDARL